MTTTTAEKRMATFDLSAEYEEQVTPLLRALFDKCDELGLPMLAVFCVKTEDDPDNPNGQGYTFAKSTVVRERDDLASFRRFPPRMTAAAQVMSDDEALNALKLGMAIFG